MDFPLPLLERLKRHYASPSLNAYPHKGKRQSPQGSQEDSANISGTKQSDAAAASPEARASHLGAESVAGSNCSSDSNAGSSTVSAEGHCRKPDSSSAKRRSLVRAINSSYVNSFSSSTSNASGIECSDTSRTRCGTIRGSTSSGNGCETFSTVSRYGATGFSVSDDVQNDGKLPRVKGCDSPWRDDSRNMSGTKSAKVARLCDSADLPVQAVEEPREEDAAQAKSATLPTRCAWSSSLHHFGGNEWVCRGLYANEGFHCVYLLRSLQTSRCTYVGYSTDPLRRLRQHNGDVSHGGAWKTRRHRPWALVLVVYGFPHAVAALQFEWRWQRTVPAASRVNVAVGGPRNEQAAAIRAGASIEAAGTRASACCGTGSPGVGLTSMHVPAELKRRHGTGSMTSSGNSSRPFSKSLHETGMQYRTPQRAPEPASSASRVHTSAAFDPATETTSARPSGTGAPGNTSLLSLSPFVERGARRAGVSAADSNRQLCTNMGRLQASFENADSCDPATSLNKCAVVCHGCSKSPHCTVTPTGKASSAGLSMTRNVASGVRPCTRMHQEGTCTQQRIPYRLSRTGGIVAHVGLRLQTLLALLHTEPFMHMPLGVHVVDAYTGARYFRLLLRERKAADLQQQPRRGEMPLRCASPLRKSRAQTRRKPAWTPLHRSLLVSFGEAALLLPLIRQLSAGGGSARKDEDSRAKPNTSDIHGLANASGMENSGASSELEGYKSRPSTKSTHHGSHGISTSTVDVVEDAIALQCAETATRTTSASFKDALCVSTTCMMPGSSARSMNDFVPFISGLPWCRLCGHAFLEEPRERPASRCVKCMCYYHLTCLARSTLGKERHAGFRAKLETAPAKCSTSSRATETSNSVGDSREITCGSGTSEADSPKRSCSGLVPLAVKCVCCGLVRSWAEVLADGVVFSSNTVPV